MNARVLLTAAVLSSGLLLAAIANGAGSAQESEFVGAAACAQCHQAEYQAWVQSPHAKALERLSEAERADARCRQCHTTAPEEPDPALSGVQCESCHGRGRYYSPRWVMKDPHLRDVLFFEQGGPETCARCHNDLSPNITPFNYTEKLRAIAHGPRMLASPDAGPPAEAPK